MANVAREIADALVPHFRERDQQITDLKAQVAQQSKVIDILNNQVVRFAPNVKWTGGSPKKYAEGKAMKKTAVDLCADTSKIPTLEEIHNAPPNTTQQFKAGDVQSDPKYLACDDCGVVVDIRVKPLPEDITDNYLGIDENKAVEYGGKWIPCIDCPVCGSKIIDRTQAERDSQ